MTMRTCRTDTLLQAEQNTKRIFLHSGVDVLWRPCRPSDSSSLECPDPGPMTPAVRLVTRLKVAPGRVHADAMGYAIGYVATVSVEFAKQLEKSLMGPLPEILGHIMAHEIGHLLLPGYAHSVTGIMRAHWRQVEWTLICQGKLNFLREEARFLRTSLLYRRQPVANQTR